MNEQEIGEFADLFNQNINEELELLIKEEEILNSLKINLINEFEVHEDSDSESLNGTSCEAKTPVKHLATSLAENDDKNSKQLISRGISKEMCSVSVSVSSNSSKIQGKNVKRSIEVNKKNFMKK
jgi:hypothetical protein